MPLVQGSRCLGGEALVDLCRPDEFNLPKCSNIQTQKQTLWDEILIHPASRKLEALKSIALIKSSHHFTFVIPIFIIIPSRRSLRRHSKLFLANAHHQGSILVYENVHGSGSEKTGANADYDMFECSNINIVLVNKYN